MFPNIGCWSHLTSKIRNPNDDMRSADYYEFLSKLESEVYARDFILFVLRWAQSEAEEVQMARRLNAIKAIELSKELFTLYILEHIQIQSTTRH